MEGRTFWPDIRELYTSRVDKFQRGSDILELLNSQAWCLVVSSERGITCGSGFMVELGQHGKLIPMISCKNVRQDIGLHTAIAPLTVSA